LDRYLSAVWERIEGLFHELQNTGRKTERLLAKTVLGLCTPVTTIITSLEIKHILRIDFGVKVQTLQAFA